jgi:hypothetical protein
MNSWAEGTAVDELIAKSREVKPRRVLLTAIAATEKAGKAAWPHVLRVGAWIAEAIYAVFVAAGWMLGFVVFCLRGVVYGFCSGAGIPQLAELAARRRAARKEDAGRAEVPGR